MAQYKQIKLSVILAVSTFSSLSYGAGFAIQEQSVTGLGRAFAGSAAVAEDASTIFFNPAGLTQLKHTEIDVGVHYIKPKSSFTDDGSKLSPAAGGAFLTGSGDDAGKEALVPNLYYAQPLNDKVVVGLGINAPFGLVTEYDDTWKGRYHAVKSDLMTININPTIAFKATDKLSFGFGLDLQYVDVELTQMADLGAKFFASPQSADGSVKLTADDWSWGYNLGLTYQLQPATRLGLAYRSKISHTVKGDGKLKSATGAIVFDEKLEARMTVPESLSFAVHHEINNQWSIMADATWTRWSRFQALIITSENGNFNENKEEKWENTMRYGIGVDYKHNDKWTFRSGIAYDESPVSDDYRTARIPGNDRKWLSVGASYQLQDNIIIDAGYTHLFVSNPKIDETDSNGYTLKGEYEASVDLLAVQVRWLFL
ncbi:long-chain fatty acid transporter [Methylophaga sp. 41_12_T18]|nr:long-chain fatty acid transporter [Methylophaga sp. 41_12_T18]